MAHGEPAAYTIRVSDRARHTRLQLTASDQLIVVIPRRFDRKRVPALVEEHRDWIERARERREKRLQRQPKQRPVEVPERIVLQALDEIWDVTLRSWERPEVLLEETAAGRLALTAPSGEVRVPVEVLHRWMIHKSKLGLAPMLHALASQHGFHVGKVIVRSQRTRWGSCSRKGTISLNFRLLVLPPDLVRYIMRHELAHLREMNHSPRFWALVESMEPAYRELRGRLRQVERQLPAWLGFDAAESF